MSSVLHLFCSCLNRLFEGNVEKTDVMEVETFNSRDNALNDLLIKNLLTIRGRRSIIRDIPVQVVATKFEDDDPPSEDENGEETPLLKEGIFANQQFDRLKSRCLQEGILFVDPQFPPSPHSLFASGYGGHDIVWKRASELSDNPHLFVGGATRFDINQGELGDCWLLAALANLTLQKKLFAHVVPQDDQSFSRDYAGIFHFKFWQYGEWIDVVVDDYLPTRNGKLLYMRSDEPNEFWSALLEKAYAKLHGSYEALRGGTTCEAMVDFSGGVGEVYDLKNSPIDIYKIMLKAYERCSLLSCSLDPDPQVFEARTPGGLVRGHAYSVTKVVLAQIDTGNKRGLFPLVRVRNPWGNEAEWKGPWSDGSKEWSYIPQEEKERLGLVFDNDGEFYMSQKDFLRNFDHLEICNLTPDTLDEEQFTVKFRWHESSFDGSWVAGSTAGGCRNFINTFARNPQYKIVLEDSDDDDDEFCTCLISLMQKGSRKRKTNRQADGCLTIGFAIYYLSEPSAQEYPLTTNFFRYNTSCGKSKSFVNLREVSARFKLRPGTYVVIPSTFEPNEEGEFLLRVFSEKCSTLHCIQE